jgi:hypothetical protein
LVAHYYYSTQPFLAWCLNHYFYGGTHFAWVGAPFYPYKRENPTSSNPFRIYQDLYEPWKDRDEYSSYLAQKRLGLRDGVHANSGRLKPGVETRLTDICNRIRVDYFYPIVYRVNIDTIALSRRIVAGSGSVGSNELRIDALAETEFDILFADITIESLATSFTVLWNGSLSEDDALDLLEKERI